MPQPTLNADVLSLITSFATGRTISSMMQANRFFYHEGPKTLLRKGAALNSDEEILKFLRFVMAEEGTRTRHLGALSLEFEKWHMPSENAISILTDVLRSCSFDSLRILHIDAAEAMFSHHPCLLDALKTLPSVADFCTHSCGMRTCELLRDMQARMTSVKLGCDEVEDANVPVQSYHPLHALQDSRDTLKEVELSFFNASISPTHYPPPYPAVQVLTVNWAEYVDYASLLHTFPNIKSLTLDNTCNELDVDDFPENPTALNAHRSANRNSFLRYGTWKTMDEVDGSLPDVYVSGVVTRVRRLGLFMSEGTFEMLSAVINDTHPSDLALYVKPAGVLNHEFGLPAVLRREGAENIKTLKLSIEHNPDEKDVDLDAGLSALISALRGLPLREIEIIFCCYELPEHMTSVQWNGEVCNSPPCAVEEFLETVQLEALGRRFFAEVGSLQGVTLALRGHRRRHNDIVKMRRDLL
ncbi:hypothetical protein BD413DRAFT_464700 [Trametes elegans]|nr:hypothetical protein BD413DRAFT_464700 [Trametes elegans]